MTGTEEDQGAPRRWSLARRLRGWLVVSVGGLLVVVTALATWFVRDTLARELNALVAEEEAELQVDLMERPLDEAFVRTVASKLDLETIGADLTVRVWRPPYDRPWVVAGAPPRLGWPAEEPPEEFASSATARDVRTFSTSATLPVLGEDGVARDEALKLEMLIDGAPLNDRLRGRLTVLLGVSWALGLAILLAGAQFAGRVSTLLRRVAESASPDRWATDVEPTVPSTAPDEIHAVVAAFVRALDLLKERRARNVLLTAGLAHELRSPLQNLITEAEVGLLRDRSGDAYRALIDRQLEELRKLALVVDNLVTLTALGEHSTLRRDEEFDLADELELRLAHERAEGAHRGVEIQLTRAGSCDLRGDREALVLMVRNLVGNAIKWSPDGGTVQIGLEGSSEVVEVTIDDGGPGVRAEERESIFEAFRQGSTPRGARAGYGLGLALARAAADAAGGSVQVTSSPRGGARFVARIPRPR